MVPLEVTAGLQTVANPHPRASRRAGAPRRGRDSGGGAKRQPVFAAEPDAAAHVVDDLDGRIDMVIDGGATDVGVESTVLDLTVSLRRCSGPARSRWKRCRMSCRRFGRPPLEARIRHALPWSAGQALLAAGADDAVPGTDGRARAALVTAAREAIAVGHRVGVVATSGDARCSTRSRSSCRSRA